MARKIRTLNAWQLGIYVFLLSVVTGGLTGWGVTCSITGKQLERWTQDTRLRHRPSRPPSSSVRLLGVTDQDLAQFGGWPISRKAHVDMANIMEFGNVRQMTFDILFTAPSSESAADEALVEAFTNIPSLTLAYRFEEPGEPSISEFRELKSGSRFGVEISESALPETGPPHPPFHPMEVSYGASNAPVSLVDGVIRKIPLFLRHEGKLYPGLAMQSLINGLEVGEDQIRIQLGQWVEIVDTPRGTIRIPIDDQARMTINFHCLLEDFHPAYSYQDLYSALNDDKVGEQIRADLEGKFFFVGEVATASTDIVTTPLGRMPGVAVQALALSNILEGSHLLVWPSWKIILLCILVSLICFVLLGISKRLWIFPLVLTGLIGALLAWSLWQAREDVLIPLTAPIITIALSSLAFLGSFVVMEKKARLKMRESFRPYLAAPLYRRLLQSEIYENLVSERKELSIFFSDIRGFTEWTEGCEAEEISEVLNQYFSTVIPVVEQFGGTLDKLMGDGMMVFFGAPEPMENHATSAVRMACKMQEVIVTLQEKWAQEARVALEVGMAVHTGYVTVGNFGSPEFSDYTVIGANVNTTARIESKAPGGCILITERTRACAGNSVISEEFGDLNLKGVSKPVSVYKVTGVSEDDTHSVP